MVLQWTVYVIGLEKCSVGGSSITFCPTVWRWGQSVGVSNTEIETWMLSWNSGEKMDRNGNEEMGNNIPVRITSLKPISAVSGISSYLCHDIKLLKPLCLK